ncbi:MAG: enoyl-CoA hydratase [Paracoccaceae bacterium]|jgi:enoyl-CoA hydratase
MSNTQAPVLLEREGSLAILTLNRPDQHNSVNVEMANALRSAIAEVEVDTSVRVVILAGAGKSFCAGMDLGAFLDGHGNEILFGENRFAGFVDAPRTKPIIAAIEGAALAGGCEIALACDMIVASETATFGLPEVGVGIFPVAGGAFRLASKIPPAKALELVLTGDRISAREANGLGLLNSLTAPGEALQEARELASRILRNAPVAVHAALAVARQLAIQNEKQLWQLSEGWWETVIASPDALEGPQAFKEKRVPNWNTQQSESTRL